MKRIGILVAVLALIAALVFLNRENLKQAAYDALTRDMFVSEDTDDFDPGPVVGSQFPGVQATWQGRDIRLLQEFYGANGTVFLAVRSAQWCPFCMRQLIQLQEHSQAFADAGIGLVAMTYDAPELQREFVDKWGISYPLLHDVDALTFKTLGILNRDYRPGDDHYGIPYPGMLVIDTRGVVVGKLFLRDYSVRVDALSALAYAESVLNPGRVRKVVR